MTQLVNLLRQGAAAGNRKDLISDTANYEKGETAPPDLDGRHPS